MSTMTSEQAVLESVPTQLYIDGQWRDGAEGKTVAVEDPATGDTIAEVADGTPDDAKAALAAAHGARAEWAATPPIERGEILRRAYEALVERADDLALLMTLEMGKPLAESKAEITYAADFFWWYHGEAARIDGHYGAAYNGKGRVMVLQQPVGPSILITPWNFPMAMGTRKIGPALAAGCTMVWKPAKQTPLSALALAKILEEAGLPGGVLNLVTSSSSGLRDGAADQGPARPQAVVHRIHRGGPRADQAVGRPDPQGVDGARRQRAVPHLRRRRSRRRGGGGAAGEDAQHRRGLHVGQPFPRGRLRGRRVRAEARGQDGLAEDRARHR